jgi:hypothetical protein
VLTNGKSGQRSAVFTSTLSNVEGVAGSSPCTAHPVHGPPTARPTEESLITGHAPNHPTREIVEIRPALATTSATVVSHDGRQACERDGGRSTSGSLTSRWLGSIQFDHDDRSWPMRKYVSAKTERDALRKAKALSRLRDDGLPPPSDRVTVEHLVRAWYDEELRSRVAETTADNCRSVFEHQVLPVLGRRSMSKLNLSDVNRIRRVISCAHMPVLLCASSPERTVGKEDREAPRGPSDRLGPVQGDTFAESPPTGSSRFRRSRLACVSHCSSAVGQELSSSPVSARTRCCWHPRRGQRCRTWRLSTRLRAR